VCEQNPSPISRLLLLADRHLNLPREDNAAAVQTRARHEVVQLERGLVILEIVVGIAPLLGLVGTIYGLIILFGGLGEAGLGEENTTLARGIALALNATLLGLLTAIPSLIAWSYYNKKVETLAVEMETLCDEFLRQHYRNIPHDSPATTPPFKPESTNHPDSPAPHTAATSEEAPPRRARKPQQG
jgi:biopolymer transport protein ExbB